MEKTISPFPFIVAGEEEKEEIKLQYPEIWHRETLTLMTRSTRKNLLKNSGSSLPLTPGEMPKEKEGDQWWWTAAAVVTLGQESAKKTFSGACTVFRYMK
jgi:hypothetical protein